MRSVHSQHQERPSPILIVDSDIAETNKHSTASQPVVQQHAVCSARAVQEKKIPVYLTDSHNGPISDSASEVTSLCTPGGALEEDIQDIALKRVQAVSKGMAEMQSGERVVHLQC